MSGFFEIVKMYPAIVREGFRLATDNPRMPKLRIDENGEKKTQEKREEHARWSQALHASGIPPLEADSAPQRGASKDLHTIYLQWRDKEYKRWVDTTITINRETKKFVHYESWILGHQHEGSSTLGILLFATPFLLLGSPYIFMKQRHHEYEEDIVKISRHGIALMRALKGQMNEETTTFLRTALQNSFVHERKMRQHPSLKEACALLDCCTLRTEIHEGDEENPTLFSFHWYDADDTRIGHANYEIHTDGKKRYYPAYVFSSHFHDDEAKELMQRFGKLPKE